VGGGAGLPKEGGGSKVGHVLLYIVVICTDEYGQMLPDRSGGVSDGFDWEGGEGAVCKRDGDITQL
jgi:hypothetical protein